MHQPSGYPGSNPPPPYAGQQPQQGYRAAGPVDTTLPLPRSGLLGWTIGHCVFALFTILILPVTAAIDSSGMGSRGFVGFLRDGGLMNWFMLLLHPLLTIAILTLGIFVVRGKRMPALLLFVIAVVPAILSVLACFYSNQRMLGALVGLVTASQLLRIAAQGYAEINSNVILGSLASACLCTTAAVAMIGSVVNVDTRRMAAGGAGAPQGSSSSNPWILGSAIGGLLVVLTIAVHLFLPSWSGGLSSKLGVVVLIAGAVAAGPMLARIQGAIADGGNSNTEEVKRVTSTAFMSAVLIALAVFLFDRAAFAFQERGALQALSGESIDPSQRARILSIFAPGVRASSINLIVDTSIAFLLFLPATVATFRRPAWGMVAATVGVVVVLALALGGWNLSRRSGFRMMAQSASFQRDLLPTDLVPLDRERLRERQGGRSPESAHEVNMSVMKEGSAKELVPRYSYSSGPYVIAADRNAPFSAVFAGLASTTPSNADVLPSSSWSSSASGNAHVLLVGRADVAGLPKGLEDYAMFMGPDFIGYEVAVGKVRAPSPSELADKERERDTLGLFGSAAAATASPRIYVLATSHDHAEVTCETKTDIIMKSVSFVDHAQAEKDFEDAIASCSSKSNITLAPSENARVEDVFKILSAIKIDAASFSGKRTIELTADRPSVANWMKTHPVGPKPAPLALGEGIGLGGGFGSLGRSPSGSGAGSPQLRMGATQVNGRLPPEVIQRIVRQNFGRFRLCYENGLAKNPDLAGRVSVKFVIDRSGSVTVASDGGSDLPDQSVVSCVVRAFSNLTFPQPEGGIVTVVYPINFSPGK